jgi:hypothetical protein
MQGGNHLLYEAQMLSNKVAILESNRWRGAEPSWQDRTLYMATVESCLVHMRSVMDCFCPPDGYESDARRANDIFASDFCTTWSCERWDGFKADWNAISEEIMHMTYLRPEVATAWPYAGLMSKVFSMLTLFVDAADRLHPHLKGQLRAVLAGGRMPTALTPTTASAGSIEPKLLSGLNSTGSVPTTSLINQSLNLEPRD